MYIPQRTTSLRAVPEGYGRSTDLGDKRESTTEVNRSNASAVIERPQFPNFSMHGLLHNALKNMASEADARRAQATQANSHLTINLDALRHNYRLALSMIAEDVTPSAVLKADGYGLSAAALARELLREGCRDFFVAQPNEAFALRMDLQKQGTSGGEESAPDQALIYCLHGPSPGTEEAFVQHDIVPVLNTIDQAKAWAALASARGKRLPAILHVNTGMNRLGMSSEDRDAYLTRKEYFDAAIDVRYLMSHLACSADADSDENEKQLEAFNKIRSQFPGLRASLAASSGLFLDPPKYHFDLVRFGGLLHGEAVVAGPSPLEQLVTLEARVLQVARIAPEAGIGYGLTGASSSSRMIATVAIGFADGVPRQLGNRGKVFINRSEAPIVGKVSMDMITIDISNIRPEDLGLKEGHMVQLLNKEYTIDDMARDADTIPADISTGLNGVGRFYVRYAHEGSPLTNIDP